MNRHNWKKKTSAKILTISRLRQLIRDESAVAVGVVGYSGDLSRNERDDAEVVVRTALCKLFRVMLESNDGPVWCISGATDLGVPRIAYQEAKRLGCLSVGVTAEAAKTHPLADLDLLSVIGEKFGDESDSFISALDHLCVLGGGQQSLAECKLASERGIPITVFQGIGGIADALTPNDVNAEFARIDEYILG